MAHFAQVINGIVQQVIVAELDFINSGVVGDPSKWIQTSYNSNIRNKFAGIGDWYLVTEDIFVSPKPYPSWILKLYETTGLDENYNISVITSFYDWTAPVPFPSTPPNEGYYWKWDENIVDWVQAINPNYVPISLTPSGTPMLTPTPI
jgi:hypothetical protein